jgi:SAM-dependent methyltransferase
VSGLRSLIESPRLYDLVQRAVGGREIARKLEPHLRSFAGSRVLDVGAGTGLHVMTVPRSAEYVALDLDRLKLARLVGRHPHVQVVVGDAAKLEFAPGSFDNALVVFLAHHLDDDALAGVVSGLSRVVRGRMVFVDALPSRSWRSRLLWSIDRGSFPRAAEQLRSALERGFTIEHEERFRVHHEYLLCVARVRAPSGRPLGVRTPREA